MSAELPGFETQQRLFTAMRAALVAVTGVTNVQRIPDPTDAQTPQLSEALLVTTAEHGQFVCLVQPQLTPTQSTTHRALNPVTFRPKRGNVAWTVGRLHVGHSLDDMTKNIPVVAWNEARQEMLAHSLLDEDTFLAGLSCLFPHGELSFGARDVCQSLVEYAERKAAGASADELERDWQQLVDQARTALT